MIYFIMLSIYHDRYNKKYMDWQSHSQKMETKCQKIPKQTKPQTLSYWYADNVISVISVFFKVLWCHSQAFYTFIQQVKEQTESKADTVNVVSITDQNKKTR